MDPEKAIDCVLNMKHWPKALSSKGYYYIPHDDNDGDVGKGISVVFSEDGDAWVNISDPSGCRFRTYIGGGRSLRVRNALMVLALAIKADVEDRE